MRCGIQECSGRWAALGCERAWKEGSTAIIMIQAQVELGSGEREYDGMEEERYHYSVLLTG